MVPYYMNAVVIHVPGFPDLSHSINREYYADDVHYVYAGICEGAYSLVPTSRMYFLQIIIFKSRGPYA